MRSAAQVLVFPAWRDNPFLNLLELAARTSGYRFLGATTYDSLLRQLRRLEPGDVFHLHWTSPLLQEAESEEDARERLERLVTEFRGVRDSGVRIVWTLHNRLPHELAHRDAEIGLYRALGELSDVVHVMAPATADVVADVVALDPATVRVIPHPSYEGIYDSGVDRVAARDSFDLGADDRAVLFLGQIRPYKGVDSLVAAAGRAVEDDPDLVLMLAGVVKDLSEEDFLRSIPADLRTITQFSFVPDGDLARWFRAADVAVFPYRAILNSGSLHLAATFRVPVILPDERHLRAQFSGCPWIAFFDPARPDASIAELLSDRSTFDRVSEADFAAFTDEISPWGVARRYRQLLDELSGASSS
ncbi:glycosyltransferase [Microbacterium sp. NPDC055683]